MLVLFQTLDDKTECVGIYTDNSLIFDPDDFPDRLSKTWKYSSYLRGMDVEYASLGHNQLFYFLPRKIPLKTYRAPGF